jgi:hydroxymethylbilane synthase
VTKNIRIGTRNSKLALIQVNLISELLERHYPEINLEIIPITTKGDAIKDKELKDIGGKDLFINAIEVELLRGNIDMAVHSAKDISGYINSNTQLFTPVAGGDDRDVLVSDNHLDFNEFWAWDIIGTSSPRRKAQLAYLTGANISLLRGNVETRLGKIKSGEITATILAKAGLDRMNLFDSSYMRVLDRGEFCPAIGQGTIAVQTTNSNNHLTKILEELNHNPTYWRLAAERGFIAGLGGNCYTPVGAYSEWLENGNLICYLKAFSSDGSQKLEISKISSTPEQAWELGREAAMEMLNQPNAGFLRQFCY